MKSTTHGIPRVVTVVVAVVVLALFVACGDEGGRADGGEDGAGTVEVTLSDFQIDMSTETVPAGEVTFDVTNEGQETHEFVVFATDLPLGDMPSSDGEVDEAASDLEVIGEVEDVAPDTSDSFTATLEAGRYVAICNVPGHYDAGMRMEFTAE